MIFELFANSVNLTRSDQVGGRIVPALTKKILLSNVVFIETIR